MGKTIIVVISILLIIAGFGMMHGGNSFYGNVGSVVIGLGSFFLWIFVFRKVFANKDI